MTRPSFCRAWLLSTAAAAILAGCASAPNADLNLAANESIARAAPRSVEERKAIETQDVLMQAAFWGEEYEKNPADREAALKFSKILRRIGNPSQAHVVATRSLAFYPEDHEFHLAAGVSAAAQGQPTVAIDHLANAVQLAPQDWRAHSALGVALDQMNRHSDARLRYTEALSRSPGNASVMTNMGLSYALGGDLVRAESILRDAVEQPNAPAEARQNLALVLGLQGKFTEAQQISGLDLPPDAAEANIALLRSWLTRPRRWDDLRALGADG